MKLKKATIISGIICFALCSVAGLSSCKSADVSSPFSYTEVKGTGVYVSYVHTEGTTSEVLDSNIEETAYYIEICVMNTDDEATVNAGDISIIADGDEYSSCGFVSFKSGVGESINGIKTVGVSYKEKAESLTLGGERFGSVYRAAFNLSSVPEAYTAYYKGVELKISDGDDIASSEYNVEDNLFMAVVASSEDETEAKSVQSIDIGFVTTQTEIIDEEIDNGTYNYVEVLATVGTEDVTAYASEFSLLVDGVSYPCVGFVEESSSYTEDGGISVTEYTVTLYNAYVIESSEVATLRPAFEVEIGTSEFEIYYGGVRLS